MKVKDFMEELSKKNQEDDVGDVFSLEIVHKPTEVPLGGRILRMERTILFNSVGKYYTVTEAKHLIYDMLCRAEPELLDMLHQYGFYPIRISVNDIYITIRGEGKVNDYELRLDYSWEKIISIIKGQDDALSDKRPRCPKGYDERYYNMGYEYASYGRKKIIK